MEIKFYTPEYETIPTRLRLKVNESIYPFDSVNFITID